MYIAGAAVTLLYFSRCNIYVRAVRFPDFFFLPVRFPDVLVQIIFYGRDEGDLGLGEAIILTGKSRDSGFGTVGVEKKSGFRTALQYL